MIEWIRHVKRHDKLESEVDKAFIREKCVELYTRVDEELFRAHPKPQASRTERSKKRTRETAEIVSYQPRLQQPKRIRRALTNEHDEQATQEVVFSPTSPSCKRVIAGDNAITNDTSIDTSYTADAFSSSSFSVSNNHDARALPSQHLDLVSLPGQMASLGPESSFALNQHMPNSSNQNFNSYAIHSQGFSVPDQSEFYMSPIFQALNYPL